MKQRVVYVLHMPSAYIYTQNIVRYGSASYVLIRYPYLACGQLLLNVCTRSNVVVVERKQDLTPGDRK